MDSPTIFANLRNILAELYPDELGTRRIVADAGLDAMRIQFSSRAVDNWHAILIEATKAGKIKGLIDVVWEEYGNNQEFLKAWTEYRVLLEHGIDPLSDDRFPGESPYKGLPFFDIGDASLFFGREQLTAQLVKHLRHQRFLVVVGASGSGKSSLVRAGLVPALLNGELLADGTLPPEGYKERCVHVVTPTALPLEKLATSLTRENESITVAITLMDDLAKDSRSLRVYIRRLLEGNTSNEHLLLVVDQFEELFTLCRDKAQQRAFVDNLLIAASEESQAVVIIILRADFYAQCAEFDNLRTVLANSQVYIGPMDRSELRRAIEEPAHQGNWQLEPGLVELMLQDVGDESGALPLLSHALLEIWKRRRGRILTLAGYAESGRVQGAIAKTADTVLRERLTTPEQQRIVRNIFLRLTELGEGTQDTRRRVALTELIPQSEDKPVVEKILKTLVDARLVTTFQNEAEVAHEALIREWPTLREWLQDDREGLRTHRRLTEAAQEWVKFNRDPGMLYRGIRLEQTQEWANSHRDKLNSLEQKFLTASQVFIDEERYKDTEIAQEREIARQRELAQAQALVAEQNRVAEAERQHNQEQRRAAKKFRHLLIGLASVLLLAVAITWFALARNRIATERSLTMQAENFIRDKNLSLATLLALEERKFNVSEGERLLQKILFEIPPIRGMALQGHTASVQSVAWKPDGTQLASSSDDQSIIIWDVISGQPVQTLRGHTASVQSVAWSPDGIRLASGSDDQSIIVWDMVSGQPVQTLRGHTASVQSVAWSPDGTQLASGSDDQSIIIWNVTSGQPVQTLQIHPDNIRPGVWSIAWKPDGTRLAAGSIDGVIVWDVTTKKSMQILQSLGERVLSVAWSPDGTRLAAGLNDQSIIIWNVTSGQPVQTLQGHTARIQSVVWSPDGIHLASSSDDGVIVWNMASGQPVQTLQTHPDNIQSGVWSIVWSPDGIHLASSSDDGVIVWNMASGQPVQTLQGFIDRVFSAAWNPAGSRLAVGGSYIGSIIVWDVNSGQPVRRLQGPIGRVSMIVWRPDGIQLASSSGEGVTIWDITNNQSVQPLQGHTLQGYINRALSAAWSPDSTRLALGSDDTTIHIYSKLYLDIPCHWVFGNLTLQQWITYRGWAIYQPTCPELPTPQLPGMLESLNSSPQLLFISWQGRFFVTVLVALTLGMIMTVFLVFMGPSKYEMELLVMSRFIRH